MEQIEKALAKAREMRAGTLAGLQGPAPAGARANGVAPDYTQTLVANTAKRRAAEDRLVADSLDHPASDVYGLLRTQVLQRMRKRGMSTLAVVGPELGSGATTTAANLAIAIALDVNQTVLLVDLNLRDPSVHRKFRFDPRAGIDDFLRGEAQLKDCLVNPGLSRLVVLPARAANGAAAEVISSPRMTTLARELKSRYSDRIIIYDTPPLLSSSDTLGFLPNVDAVLLVARRGQTTKAQLEKSAGLLGNTPIIGTLLNAY